MNYVLPPRFKNVKTYCRVQPNLQQQFQHTKLRLLKKKKSPLFIYLFFFFLRERTLRFQFVERIEAAKHHRDYTCKEVKFSFHRCITKLQ